MSVVGDFLSTTCKDLDLTIGAVTVIANILQNFTHQVIPKEDENASSDPQVKI